MRGRGLLVVGFLVVLCLVAIPALAQEVKEAQQSEDMQTVAVPAVIADQLDAMRAQIAANGWQFTVGYNRAMDYPLADLCGVKHYAPTQDMRDHFAGGFFNPEPLAMVPQATLPSRYVGWASSIKDQGQCGSCWSFSMAAEIEAAYLMESGAPQVVASTTSVTSSGSSPDLSEQHIISCNSMGYGCDGGNVDAFSEFMPNSGYYNGVVSESCFPYASSSGTAPSCHLCSSPTYTPVVSWGYLTNDSTDNTVTAIKNAIYQYGSVTAYIYADNLFQAYTGGVFTDSASGQTNHAIILCGWDDSLGSSGAWLLKNSWGSNTGWGINGWMWIAYGTAHVGQGASWVTSNGAPTQTYSISGTVSGAVTSGVTMNLTGAKTASTTTGTGGTYTFSGLANGSYTVTPSLSGYSFSPASTNVTVNGANVSAINFTSTAVPTYSISGTVSGAVTSGVTMNLTGAKTASTTTGTGGTYTFSGLANGSYTVTPSLSGYTFSPASTAVTISNANQTNINFTSTQNSGPTTLFTDGFEGSGWSTAQVSGTAGAWTIVTSSSHPSISAHGGTHWADFNSYTSASGSQTRIYRSSGFSAGSYGTITLTFWMYHDTSYSSDADKVQAQVSTNGTTWTNVGTAVNRYTGSTGWTQATVDLSAYSGQTVYLGFLGISAYGSDCYIDDVLVTGSGTGPTTYTVSGTITYNSAGLSGVTVSTTGASATTNSSGAYTLSGLANGTYTVTPSLSGYTFSPTSQSVTVNGANVTGINFTATPSSGPVTLFSNGFESSSGWASAQVSGTAGAWSLKTSGTHPSASPHGGSYLADFNSYTSASGSQTRYYRTSGFAVGSSYSTVTLTFWMYHDTGYSTYADKVQAQVSTNGTTWTSVGSAVARYNGTTGWAQVTINLSAYKGQTVYLGFLGISAYGNDEYLDDVTVTAQ